MVQDQQIPLCPSCSPYWLRHWVGHDFHAPSLGLLLVLFPGFLFPSPSPALVHDPYPVLSPSLFPFLFQLFLVPSHVRVLLEDPLDSDYLFCPPYKKEKNLRPNANLFKSLVYKFTPPRLPGSVGSYGAEYHHLELD